MKELEKVLKELNNKRINLIDLDIMQEINYQSEFCYEMNLNEYEKELLLNTIHNAYLKSEDLTIYQITTIALENLKELKNMSTWDLVEKTCWRF